ncbi:MAG TPA: hypothetical protein VMJ35_10915 [Dongiaceae bacterium]|nr:hypothetical protein [Dongiaceae bacterium]
MPDLKRSCLRFAFFFCFLSWPVGPGHAQVSDAHSPLELLDHLAGQWVLQGTIAGKQTTHDVQANWVLKREYLRLHESSREKDSKGDPAYEAIVFIGWDAQTQQYACLWLDSTAGGGLSAPGIAHGKRSGDSIPFLFTLSASDSIRNTFVYDRRADTWKWLIDNETNGKSQRFADVNLSRAR